MSLNSILGVISPVHILWTIVWHRARFAGVDGFGNRYFVSRWRSGYNTERRWVIYGGRPEASKVPPEWHGWLHHQTDELPLEGVSSFRREWQRPYKPNLTGTEGAYRPPGSLLQGGKRDRATGDYEAWTPPGKQ